MANRSPIPSADDPSLDSSLRSCLRIRRGDEAYALAWAYLLENITPEPALKRLYLYAAVFARGNAIQFIDKQWVEIMGPQAPIGIAVGDAVDMDRGRMIELFNRWSQDLGYDNVDDFERVEISRATQQAHATARPTLVRRAGGLVGALPVAVAALPSALKPYSWHIVVLAASLMVSLSICLAAWRMRPPPPARYRFETLTYQRDGHTTQRLYKIDQETGESVEIQNSVPVRR